LRPADVPLVGGVRIDSGVLLFALAISALSGTLVGAAPALAAARLDLNQALRGRASAGRMFGLMGHRFRSTLAALEIALALALVIGAALLTQSFGNLMKADPGFESRNRIAVEIDLDFFEYAYERVAEFYEQAAARVRAIPGVRTVGLVSALPVESAESSDETLWRFTIAGRPAPPPPGHSANFRIVNADYFRAMGIPLRRGRFFTAQDGAGASVRLPQPGVVIINEAMAHRFWSRQDPLGRLIVLELYPSPYQLRARIEGIVGNLRGPTPGEQPEPTMYFHHRQTPWNHMWLVAQTQADPAALLPAVRKHLSALGRGPIVAQAHTMEEVLAESIAVQRLMAAGSAAFALLALFLAGMGVYGVTACSVVLRTREIGVRMTLGATRGRIAATIVKEGLVLIGCGLSVGLACALLFTRAIANQLYGMAPLDPGTWVCATLVLLAAALAGCLLPAYRASRIPIAEILRYE
jgi:predicted permease